MSFVNAVAKGTTLNDIYPIGSVIIKNAPWAGFAGQTWELFSQGKTLVGQDSNDADFTTLGQTGGSKTHTLLETEMPSHTHSYLKSDNTLTGYNQNGGGTKFGSYHITNTTINTGSTGGGQPHSIMNVSYTHLTLPTILRV